MASTKRTKKRERRRGGLRVFAALFVCAALFLGYMYGSARVVHVRYATLHMRDLPAALEGLTLLYASDFDIKGAAEGRAAAKLMKRVAALNPDILLLGGDYISPTLWDALNGAEPTAHDGAFFAALSDFPARLGKFAVRGADDGAADAVARRMEAGGVRLLDDQIARLSFNGADFVLAGLAPDSEAAYALGREIAGGDFAILLSHSPGQFVRALTSDARDGGAWADLLLAGATHGGQMRVAGRTLLTLTEHERMHPEGWSKEGNAHLLISQGVGCEFANLRLGTRSEVHFITLRRSEGE